MPTQSYIQLDSGLHVSRTRRRGRSSSSPAARFLAFGPHPEELALTNRMHTWHPGDVSIGIMEQRTDTLSSGRFGGQWAFLSHPPPPPNHDQARSLPPASSYIRSDRSSVSPLPTGLHLQHLNASRSSLPRNIYTPSVGGYSSATIPSQPVLVRINSADASHHLHPVPRPPTRRPIMSKNNELPPIQEYSFEGILGTISEDIEEDVNAIANILGRSRLVLADQHDSHLPPTGEIRATPLQAVAEASASNERLAADNVMILHDEASLVDGSHSGSAAYGLLERLQALPRTSRMHSELPTSPTRPRAMSAERSNSSPAVLTDVTPVIVEAERSSPTGHRASRDLLRTDVGQEAEPVRSRATTAVVSEVYLLAGADGRVLSDPPIVSEAGRHYPLYSYDESDIFEGRSNNQASYLSFRERMRRLVLLQDFQGVTAWIARPQPPAAAVTRSSTAESRLRNILGRQTFSVPTDDPFRPHVDPEQDMYD